MPATFHRDWFDGLRAVNRRFAEAVCEVAAEGATVWVHDYQLQLVPAMVRELRPDVRIGWFNHIPFPPVELFAQLPWRRAVLEGLLGADFLGFQRSRRRPELRPRLPPAARPADQGRHGLGLARRRTRRRVRASAVPISIDFTGPRGARARRPETWPSGPARSASRWATPRTLLLGVDRLDYTKGIRHRLKAYEELLAEGGVAPPDDSARAGRHAEPRARRRLPRAARRGRGRRSGGSTASTRRIGAPAVHYLHHSYPREEMAALYLAADVMLVTPLRDGMNLVAKEYVTCRHDEGGALVLSEFTGACHELHQAFVCNPHDIEGLKQTILRGDRRPRRRRSAASCGRMRRRVADHDVQRWAAASSTTSPGARAAEPPRRPDGLALPADP